MCRKMILWLWLLDLTLSELPDKRVLNRILGWGGLQKLVVDQEGENVVLVKQVSGLRMCCPGSFFSLSLDPISAPFSIISRQPLA